MRSDIIKLLKEREEIERHNERSGVKPSGFCDGLRAALKLVGDEQGKLF